MTAPVRRRPLPAIAFIGALCLLTALVWFRVLHRTDADATAHASKSACPTPSPKVVQNPNVLPAPSGVSVLVLNSTQRNGIATATKLTLEQRGFTVTKAADDTKAYGGHGLIKGVAEIRYGPAAHAGATLLHVYFPTATMKATTSTGQLVMVSLGSKFKKVATSAAVRTALQKAHLTISTTVTPTPSASPTC